MIIKVRFIENAEAVPFTKTKPINLDAIIEGIDHLGGFYCVESGAVEAISDVQFVLSETEAYVEIIVGTDTE